MLLTVGAAVTAAAIGAGLYMWGIPAAAAVLAARVPVSWEERLGQAAVQEITASKRRCADAEREEAIGEIVKRLLEPQPRAPYTVRVIVVDDLTVNAFAVPGGQVVLLRGLVERARTPEELAGVLAHELQHVLQRHTTRLLLQHASTGLLLVAVSGRPHRSDGVRDRKRAGARDLDVIAATSRAKRMSKGYGCCWRRTSIREG